MQKYSLFSALAAVTALSLLSGCNVYHDLVGKPRVGMEVTGPMRVPVENQQDLATPVPPSPGMMVLPPPPPGDMPPPPPPGAAMPLPPTVNPAEANPYDYYDQSGQPVAPKKTAHMPPQSSLGAPDVDAEAMRKELSDNSSSAYAYLPPPVPPALPEENVPSLPPIAGAAPDSAQRASSSHASTFFAGLFGGGNSAALSPADKAAEIAPYAALSSVPPTPPELQADRAANPQGMQQLQTDWQAAQQDKQALDAEPSNLPPPAQAPAAN